MNCHPVFGCRGHSHPNMNSELTNILIKSIVLTIVEDIKTEFNGKVDVLAAKDIQLDNKIDAAVQTIAITTGSLQTQITDLVPTRDAYTIAKDSGFVGTEVQWLASLKGDKGLKGDTGARGLTGPKGDNGLDGAIGKTGPKGDIGLTGDIGPKGATGAKGATGDIGPIGPIGKTGLTGSKGDRGDTGAKGAIGLTGAKGDTGPRGLPGKDGETGARGIQGPIGVKGDRGIQGPKGETGLKGDTGLQGIQGIQGITPYQQAVEEGFSGTTKQWLTSLKPTEGTLQALTLFMNNDAETDVTVPELGNVPSLQGHIKQMFAHGGLAATPFTTKSLMEASALVDADYAMVTNDTTNNGLYVKTAGAWVKSGYDPLGQLLSYLNDALPTTFTETPAINPAANKYLKSRDLVLGSYIKSTTRLVMSDSRTALVSVPVTAGQRVIVNSSIIDSTLAMSYSTSAKPAIGEKVTSADAIVSDNLQTSIVPSGMTHLNINVLLPTVGLDITDSLIINTEDGYVYSYDGQKLADKVARDALSVALYKSSLGLESSVENIYSPSSIVSNKYVKATGPTAGALNTSTGTSLAQIKVVAGETYNIYSPDFNPEYMVVSTTEKSISEGQATSTKISDLPTSGENTVSVKIPTGHNWVFINLVIPQGDYDITNDLTVIRKEAIVSIDGSSLRDVDAHKRLDDINIAVSPSHLNGKKWVAIGDSITEKNYRANINYHDYVSTDVGGMQVYNYGKSGTGYFNRHDAPTLVTQKDADYVTVFLGTNDWGNQTASNKKVLGSFLDTGTTTISGCINTLLTDVLTNFPTAKIGVLTPLPRLTNWGSNAANNDYGYTLEQLSALIKQYCNHYSIPCLDLYHASNLPVWVSAANNFYFTAPKNSTPDGLHPNDAGHRVIGDKVKAFLESI